MGFGVRQEWHGFKRDFEAQRAAFKLAQGNALGIEHQYLKSPERAASNCYQTN
jgi:hypothetical protein